MGISTATVRAHKFNLQKAKREAKILLALLEILKARSRLFPARCTERAERSLPG